MSGDKLAQMRECQRRRLKQRKYVASEDILQMFSNMRWTDILHFYSIEKFCIFTALKKLLHLCISRQVSWFSDNTIRWRFWNLYIKVIINMKTDKMSGNYVRKSRINCILLNQGKNISCFLKKSANHPPSHHHRDTFACLTTKESQLV